MILLQRHYRKFLVKPESTAVGRRFPTPRRDNDTQVRRVEWNLGGMVKTDDAYADFMAWRGRTATERRRPQDIPRSTQHE